VLLLLLLFLLLFLLQIVDETLMGFRKRDEAESPEPSEGPTRSGPSYTRPTTASAAQGKHKASGARCVVRGSLPQPCWQHVWHRVMHNMSAPRPAVHAE
jgi:hypothetical protein